MSQWPQQGYSGQQGYAPTGGQNAYGSAARQPPVCPLLPSLAPPCRMSVDPWLVYAASLHESPQNTCVLLG